MNINVIMKCVIFLVCAEMIVSEKAHFVSLLKILKSVIITVKIAKHAKQDLTVAVLILYAGHNTKDLV